MTRRAEEWEGRRDAWERSRLEPARTRTPERRVRFSTISDVEIRALYGPWDLSDADPLATIGLPGEPPFARGIHPTVLTELGLGAAIENLADRATIPVDLTLADDRCSEVCEATAYFVVSEALANIAKHARASRAAVTVGLAGGDLRVEVADDGVGGASFETGGGLRGLVDRVAAVGGSLVVESPADGGTRLVADIPCG